MTDSGVLRVAVLISGSGTNLQAIIDAIAAEKMPVKLVAVLSDQPDAFGLQRAAAAGIPTIPLNYKAFASRSDYDASLASELAKLRPDLVVLAGYMRILPTQIVNTFSGRMLNVHPSLLPAYPGLHTYARVLAAGEQRHGATVHYVIPELDSGPAIIQYRVAIEPGDTEASLRGRVQAGEYRIYPQAIHWIAEGRLRMENNQVLLDNRPLTSPVIIEEDRS
jgi:phosphoribosylglycinamide formyltransferase-1